MSLEKIQNISNEILDAEVNDIYDEIDNIDLTDKTGQFDKAWDLHSEWNLPKAEKAVKGKNSILTLLNNHSRIIQTKE